MTKIDSYNTVYNKRKCGNSVNVHTFIVILNDYLFAFIIYFQQLVFEVFVL